MFVIKPDNYEEWQHAMFILSYYQVQCTMHSDGDNFESAYMVVAGPASINRDNTITNNIRMAEACFQMNWHQGGMICHHCEREDQCLTCNVYSECADPGNKDCSDSSQTCGHLTFVKRIKPAF